MDTGDLVDAVRAHHAHAAYCSPAGELCLDGIAVAGYRNGLLAST